MLQQHKDFVRPAPLLLLALLFFQAIGSVLSIDDGTCYSRQHRDTAVDLHQALDHQRTVMEARLKPAERDCILDCCAEELKPGLRCNMVVFKQSSQAENCYLLYCETEQDCPLMQSKPGINTYDIFKGQLHPAAKGTVRTTAMPLTNSSQQPIVTQTSTATPPLTTTTTTTQPTTTTTSTTPSTTTTATTPLPTTRTTTTTTTTTATTTTTSAAPTELSFILLTMPLVTIPPITATTSRTTTTTTTTQPTTTTTKAPSTTSVGTTTIAQPRQPLHPPSNPIRPSKKPSKPLKKPEPHWKFSTKAPTTPKQTTQKTTPTTTTITSTTTTTSTTTITTTASTERMTVVVVEIKNDLKNGDPEADTPMHPALPTANNKAKKSHTIWKNSLVALVILTLIILTLVLAIVGRKAMESFDRRHYTRLELNDLHYEI